eukprot:Seg2206.2 transcript_id=Seg2206.2/GoldUCD/mRNA.D3Y31 product="JmjC domain-containing protein 7" protein_id=Seg2206.2/GoldUCD/D3Y31
MRQERGSIFFLTTLDNNEEEGVLTKVSYFGWTRSTMQLNVVSIFLLLFVGIVSWQYAASTTQNGNLHPAHMKPFGAHMDPAPVDEFKDGEMPSAQDFWSNYVKKRKPVVFRGAAKNSPAMEKWTDEYLAEKFGDFEVRLEARKEKQGYIPIGDKGVGRDTIKNFVETYHKANKYIVSELPKAMHDDIMVLPGLSCGEMSDRIVEVDWWMNGGKASSIIHKDAFNQINCLMNGTKEWKLIEYKYEKRIYKAWEPEREVGGYSRVNPEKVDLIKYPKVATVPWMFTIMNAGDCLYLPGSMYHQVKSNGTNNFAVSLLFSRFDDRKHLNFTGCPEDAAPNSVSLGTLDVDWQYPGTGTMTMGAQDLETIREHMTLFLNKKGKFLYKAWVDMLKLLYEGKEKSWIENMAKENYNKVKKMVGGPLNKKVIETLPKTALRELALAFQPMDASNTYDHEYTYINPNEIGELINKLVKEDGHLTRAKFIEQYQKDLFGTEKFATEIMDKIAGEATEIASKEQVHMNKDKALKKYFEMQRIEPEAPEGEHTEGDAYDSTNIDTEMFETGMPDMSDDDDDNESVDGEKQQNAENDKANNNQNKDEL